MKFVNNVLVCSDDAQDNFIENDGVVFDIEPLNFDFEQSKGGNSFVFKIFDSDAAEYRAIKFCKYPIIRGQNNKTKRLIDRFYHEISALERASSFDSIVNIHFNGIKEIEGKRYLYYVMDLADCDLTEYLNSREVSIDQKIMLCSQILAGINDLHSLDLYHRDIKPDNIFFIEDKWCIGDLGLAVYRAEDSKLYRRNEKIGPYGWLSPEAMNKVLCAGTKHENYHKCQIDKTSDIFQLGKLFWYIFNGNVPIGQLARQDFLLDSDTLYEIVQLMLQYDFNRRPEFQKILIELQKVEREFLT